MLKAMKSCNVEGRIQADMIKCDIFIALRDKERKKHVAIVIRFSGSAKAEVIARKCLPAPHIFSFSPVPPLSCGSGGGGSRPPLWPTM